MILGDYTILAQPCDYPPPVEIAILDYSTFSDWSLVYLLYINFVLILLK